MRHPWYVCSWCSRRFLRSMMVGDLCRTCDRALKADEERAADAAAAARRDAA